MLSEAIDGHKGEAMFRQACRMGLEDVVSKRIESRYVSGRTRQWLKLKDTGFERLQLLKMSKLTTPRTSEPY